MLTRAIEAVLRADDYGYKTEEFLMLVISAAIRTTITDNAETISPEATLKNTPDSIVSQFKFCN